MDNTFIQFVSIIFGILGSIAGIIGTAYGIKKKREISRLQSKAEKARASSYRAKTKAENARQAEHATGAIKNFIDLFRGNKDKPNEGSAQIY